MLFDTPIGEITGEHLQALVDEGVEESRRLDFKSELPGGTDKDRRDFLADVSAFANTDGGDLLFGVDEDDSVAARISGVGDVNVDTSILRLEQMMQTGIDERIPGYQVRPVHFDDGRVVIVLRVPRSFARPHMVSTGGLQRFCGRAEKGNYQLDVREIRELASRSTTLAQRARAFLAERYMLIKGAEDPLPLPEGPRLTAHVIPVGALEVGAAVDIAQVEDHQNDLWKSFWPLGHIGGSQCWVAEGLMVYNLEARQKPQRYCLISREGVIEGVDTGDFAQHLALGPIICSVAFEEHARAWTRDSLKVLHGLSVPAPALVSVALLGVKGYRMSVSDDPGVRRPWREMIVKEDLVAPPQMLTSYDDDVEAILKRAFDILWNAAGWAGSLNYGEDGSWRPHGR